MKEDIDRVAREAFARMVAEVPGPGDAGVGDAYVRAASAERIERNGRETPRERKTRPAAALALVAAAFFALAVLPPLASRGRPSFAERAALLPSNEQLIRYAELLRDSRVRAYDRLRRNP